MLLGTNTRQTNRVLPGLTNVNNSAKIYAH